MPRSTVGSGRQDHEKIREIIWRDIPGWETRYRISEYGDVMSKDMQVGAKGGKTAVRKGRMLTPVAKSNRYLCVTLTDGTNRPQIAIHRLAARAFIGECPIGLHVLHFDGNCLNNHFSNLRYGTPAENVADTKRHGRLRYGEDHANAKLTQADVDFIRSSYQSNKELAKRFDISQAHVSAVIRKRCWR